MTTAQSYLFTMSKLASAIMAPEPKQFHHNIDDHYFVILSRETDAPVHEIKWCWRAEQFVLTGVKRQDVATVNDYFNRHPNAYETLAGWVVGRN